MKWKSKLLVSVVALCCYAVAAYGQGSNHAHPTPTNNETSEVVGDAVRGKVTWNRVGCYTCHGYAAQGADTTGPKLSGRDLPMPVVEVFVRTPSRTMPPYSRTMLSDDELRDIVAYINSIQVSRSR